MKFIKTRTDIDFIATRKLPMIISAAMIVATVLLLVQRGINFGLDFTGGTLVELGYAKPVEVATIRKTLAASDFSDAVVQYFGSSQQIMVRIPGRKADKAGQDTSRLSTALVEVLRTAQGERFVRNDSASSTQQCSHGSEVPGACQIQVRRVEFVGPQVGRELAEKGFLALIYTLIAIMIYVTFRFEWKYAVAAVAAIAHDVLITFGFFSLTQMEFSLPVLAALLAVLGYSLNDTIVVFDRIRENFRNMRKDARERVLNTAINQTLSRTIITSLTTMVAVLSLFFFGGEAVRGFSAALIVGIVVGTYSSIYVATPIAYALRVSREDLIPPKKEGEDLDEELP